MRLSKQAAAVLTHLVKWGSDTESNITLMTGIPGPSIRRTIQTLQDKGYHISYAGADGRYSIATE